MVGRGLQKIVTIIVLLLVAILVTCWLSSETTALETITSETTTEQGITEKSESFFVKTDYPEVLDEYQDEITNVTQLNDDLYIVTTETPEKSEELSDELEEKSAVKKVLPDIELKIMDDIEQGTSETTQDDLVTQTVSNPSNLSWGVNFSGFNYYIDYLNNLNSTNEVVVAVLDTGIYANHEVFRDSTGRSRLCTDRGNFNLNMTLDYVNLDHDPADDNGHGTHVAGVVAESTPSNVCILPVKVLNNNGLGSLSNLLSAMSAISHIADVINISLGISNIALRQNFLEENGSLDKYYEFINEFDEVARTVTSNGVTIVGAAGNYGENEVTFPASSQYVLAASSISRTINGYEFTRYWPDGTPGSNYGTAVTFAMPGANLKLPNAGNLYSSCQTRINSCYSNDSGTSFSSPYLASAAALILSDPAFNNADLLTALKSYATDYGEEGWDQYYGFGVIDFYEHMFKDGRTAPEEDSNAQIIKDGVYSIHSALDLYKVIDISGGSSDDRANIQLYSENKTPAQKFIFRHLGDNVYQIENLRSGKLLDIQNGSNANGANVQQYTENSTCAQKWKVKKGGDGWLNLVSTCNGKYLDIASGSSSNGANVQIYQGNNTNAQKFAVYNYIEIPTNRVLNNSNYIIQSKLNTNRVLDISGAGKQNGANLQLYTANGTSAQTFAVRYLRDGFYRIINLNSNKVLDVAGGVCDNGANVQQYSWNGTSAQQWLISKTPDNQYTLISRCNLYYLDAAGGKSNNFTNLQIYQGNNTLAQKFNFVAR